MMNNHSRFQLSEQTHTGMVALKVADLPKMTGFYQDLGLHVLETTPQQTILGVEQTPLIILKQLAYPNPLTRKTGLYHVAFLLPTRKDLGNTLFHYVTAKIPIDGASDHGYSEALYLTDPEGNGIEVYRDKPMSEWDIREDGEIVGITVAMDADGVLAAGDRSHKDFPAGTKIGHVHLKVADLETTETFYTEILGFSLKSDFGNQAKFFAAGTYHHHVGTNIWSGRQLPPMDEKDLGLDYVTFFVKEKAELEALVDNWQEKEASYEASDTQLQIIDQNSIQFYFQVAQ